MAVVGTDDEPVLPRITNDIRDIVIDLAGNIYLVFLKKIFRHGLAVCSVTNRGFAIDPRHPLSRGFNKRPAELRKVPRHLAHQQGETRGYRRYTKQREGRSRSQPIEIAMIRIGIGSVNGDRQVKIGGGLVDGIEIRVAEMP